MEMNAIIELIRAELDDRSESMNYKIREALQDKKGSLDINSKMGEFAAALCRRYYKMGIKQEEYSRHIYSIPSSSHAYEFTRKIYEILGLDTNNIAAKFVSYDLLNVKILVRGKEKIDNAKIAKLLNQDKPFCEISLDKDKCSIVLLIGEI